MASLRVFLIAFYLHSNGQVISGIIIDATTKETIPNATVYYDQTFNGTISDKNGHFELPVLNNGSLPLVFSAIGYYSVSYRKYHESEFMEICLQSKVYSIEEISINSKSLEKIRKRYLRIFKKQFQGTTSNAKHCEILNEKDITFNYNSDSDTIKAYAMQPIKILNYALGYKIIYYLNKFEYSKKAASVSIRGTSIFNEDLNISGKSKKSYSNNRLYSYYGSRMHFIRSLYLDSLSKADYQVRNQQ